MVVMRAALMGAAVGTMLGILLGILYSFGGLIVDLFTMGLNYGTLLAFGALIGMPLIFGASGLAVGIFVGLVLKVVRPPGEHSY